MNKQFDVTVHRGYITDDDGLDLHTRIDVIRNVEGLDRARAIAATYRRNGYVVAVYQTSPFEYKNLMRDVA